MHQGNFDFTLDQITKIEGHASLHLKVKNGIVEQCTFNIPEYKRFYTQAVKGKKVQSMPQMVARICGTCSNAHLLCSILAIEDAFGMKQTDQTYLLRRLLMNALMIRDHALHLYVFVLPDLYDRESLLTFDENNNEEHELVHDAFAIKEMGNILAKWVGGRSVHAPTPAIGGFSLLPEKGKQDELILKLEMIRSKVLKAVKIFNDCDFQLYEDVVFSALQNDEYDFLGKTIITADNACVPSRHYSKHLNHVVKPYSQASAYTYEGKIFMVGALSRINLSKDVLHTRTKKNVQEALKVFPSKNIFHNNLAQAIEILHCVDDSIDIIKKLKIKQESIQKLTIRKNVGIGVIEAPRGTLYHRFEIDDTGTVTHGDIIVPTGQNQLVIEKSIRDYSQTHLNLPQEMLSHELEKIIRAYDPCMSCASHFLKLTIEELS